MNPLKSSYNYLQHHRWSYAAVVVFLLIMSFWNGITEWIWDKNVATDEWKSHMWLVVLCVLCTIILAVRGITSKAFIKADSHYIHEIQHVLRREFHNEHLRLRQQK